MMKFQNGKICLKKLIVLFAFFLHIWIVASVLSKGHTSFVAPFYNDSQVRSTGTGSDFYSLYHASLNTKAGLSPFELNKDGITPPFYPYRYLPALAYMGQIFTFFTPKVAYTLWIILIEILLFYFIHLLYKKNGDLISFIIVSSALLLSSPYFLEIYMGQFTFVTTVLCLIALLKENPITQGICFGLSVFLKPFTLVTSPVFLLQPTRWLAIIAATFALIFSVPFFQQHPDLWKNFYETNFHPTGSYGVRNFGMIQFLFLIANQFRLNFTFEDWNSLMNWARSSLFIFSLLLVFFSKANRVLLGCFLLLAHFLTFQHTWEHHMSGVVAIAALLLSLEKKERWFYISAGICLIVLVLPTPFYLFNNVFITSKEDAFLGWPIFTAYLLVIPKAIPTLFLYISTLSQIFSEGFTKKSLTFLNRK